MTFLWSIHLYPPVHNCGSELMAHQISKFLISKGHTVRVLLHQANRHKITKVYEWEGVTVFPPQQKEALYSTCDVILTHLEYTQESIWAARKHRKKLVHFVHNSSPYPSILNAPEAHVVYNSEWIKEELKYPNNSFVMTPPCDYRFYDVCEKPIDNEYITLINLDTNKGGKILQKLARLLPERKFLAVKGSYSVDDEGQITNQPPNVKVIDNTPDIRSVYKQTRVLLMPSLYESWGRTATEAMCSGIPVIASRTKGLDENLGKAGLFLDDREDVEQIVRWLKRLDDKKFYNQVSKMSRERSRELDPIEKLNQLEYWLTKRQP